MRWLMLVLFVVALLCLGAGYHTEHVARSEDEAVGAVVWWGAATALFAVDALLLVIVAAKRLL